MPLTSFQDLSRAEYLTYSRERKTIDFVGARYKNIKWELRPEKSYRVSESDRANLPGIAHRMYGDVGYWWIIALYNGIVDPIGEIAPPLTLMLPSQASINTFLSRVNRTNSRQNLVTF